MGISSITIVKDNLNYNFTIYNNQVWNVSIIVIDKTKSHIKHKHDWIRNIPSYIKTNENIIHNKIILELLLIKYIANNG